ncbi:hypothetical protein ACFQ0M_42230 [Kitasatospora aburaviensis]
MNSSNDLPDQDGRPEPQRPVWPRNLALSLAAAAAAYGVMTTVGSSDEGDPGHRAAAAPPATAASAADRPAVPLDRVFPAEVKAADGTVYTRVTAKAQLSCPPEGRWARAWPACSSRARAAPASRPRSTGTATTTGSAWRCSPSGTRGTPPTCWSSWPRPAPTPR